MSKQKLFILGYKVWIFATATDAASTDTCSFQPQSFISPLYQILNNLTRKIQDVSLLATCGSSQKYKILKTARG